MKKIGYIMLVVALMALVISLAPVMSVSQTSPLYTHFVYMFAHANWMHWLINSWGLLMLHNLYNLQRLAVAYVVAVALSFVYYPALPVLGASVFISFFTGFMFFWLYKKRRHVFWQVLALLIFGCFIPHIAAAYHIIMFVAGLIYNRIEWLKADYDIFTK